MSSWAEGKWDACRKEAFPESGGHMYWQDDPYTETTPEHAKLVAFWYERILPYIRSTSTE